MVLFVCVVMLLALFLYYVRFLLLLLRFVAKFCFVLLIGRDEKKIIPLEYVFFSFSVSSAEYIRCFRQHISFQFESLCANILPEILVKPCKLSSN